MEIVVLARVTEIQTREHDGTTYYDAVAVEELFNSAQEVVRRNVTRIGIDADHLPEVTKAVREANGERIALTVRASARPSKRGFPWISWYGARLWDGAL